MLQCPRCAGEESPWWLQQGWDKMSGYWEVSNNRSAASFIHSFIGPFFKLIHVFIHLSKFVCSFVHSSLLYYLFIHLFIYGLKTHLISNFCSIYLGCSLIVMSIRACKRHFIHSIHSIINLLNVPFSVYTLDNTTPYHPTNLSVPHRLHVSNGITFPPSNKSPIYNIPIENKLVLYALLDPIFNSLLYHNGWHAI